MKFYFVPYHIVKDKIRSIIEANKTDFAKHYGDVDVDYNYFESLSIIGRAYVALAVEKDVVGFAGYTINENSTHKGLEAENIVFYITKEKRGNMFKDLLDFSKKELARIGVPKIAATIKSDALSRSLRRSGFKKQYEIWEVST